MAACQDRLDRAAVSADRVLRSLDEARIPLAAIAKESTNHVDRDWAQAGALVRRSAEQASSLGTELAVSVAGPLERDAKTIEYGEANLYGADDKVKKNAKAAGARASETSKGLQASLDPLRQQGMKVAVAVAQALAGVGAPVSRVAAAEVLKAVDTARWKLQDAVRDAQVVQRELYSTRQEASAFTGTVRDGLQGNFATPPTTYAGELDDLRGQVEKAPAALRNVDAGLRLAAPSAANLNKLFYKASDALRTLASAPEAERTEARHAAVAALHEMRACVDGIQQAGLGGGPRVVADSLAPIWAQVREPGQRVDAMDKELRAKDDESGFWFFGRQYGKTHDALEPAFSNLSRGAFLAQSGLERGLEMPVRFLELQRLLDDCVHWAGQDPELAHDSISDDVQRVKRLVMDVTLSLPDIPGQNASGTGSLLGNAARFLEAGMGGLKAGAEVAREKEI